jgi:hypothetical protein
MKLHQTIPVVAVAVLLAMVFVYIVQDLHKNSQIHDLILSTGTINDIQVNEEKIQQKPENCKPESLNTLQNSQNDVDWRSADVTKFTSDQLHDYLYWSNRSSCNLIHDFGGFMINATILRKLWGGSMGLWKTMEQMPVGIDGQYPVCLDPIPPTPGHCLVYSFGINNEWSFDQHFDSYGCQVYSFDASIGLEHFDKTPNIHFYGLFLGSKDENKTLTLSTIYKMLVPKHGEAVIDYLKIDIEANEWHVLPQIVQSGMLQKVRQLAIEAHFSPKRGMDFYQKTVAGTIKSIEDTGMVRFDSRYAHFCAIAIEEIKSKYSCLQMAWYNPKLLPEKLYFEN